MNCRNYENEGINCSAVDCAVCIVQCILSLLIYICIYLLSIIASLWLQSGSKYGIFYNTLELYNTL